MKKKQFCNAVCSYAIKQLSRDFFKGICWGNFWKNSQVKFHDKVNYFKVASLQFPVKLLHRGVFL